MILVATDIGFDLFLVLLQIDASVEILQVDHRRFANFVAQHAINGVARAAFDKLDQLAHLAPQLLKHRQADVLPVLVGLHVLKQRKLSMHCRNAVHHF
ncbi:hypothetical protein D9M71_661640 [compost metagenome]